MAELPHMPMFWGDYFGDTTHLSVEEHGAYLLLIGQYWLRGCGLPDDDTRLSRLTRMSVKQWREVKPTIAEFFAVGNGVWLHNRIERELADTRHKVEQARSAANKRWANRAQEDGKADAKRTYSKRSANGYADASANAMPSRTRTNNNPLTPLRGAGAEAPGPSGGRASAGTDAKPIGEIVKNLGRTKS